MNLAYNERVKYGATLINTVAAACLVAGVVAPLVALTFGVPGPIAGTTAAFVSVVWFLIGLSLHLLVRFVLGKLRE